MVMLGGPRSFLPTGSADFRPGTLRAILRDLDLTLDELRR